MATARLSGMMLDYQKLMKLGINGIIDLLKEKNQNEFIKASIDAMILLKDVIERQKELVNEAIERTNNINRKSELTLMYNSLDYIKENKPKNISSSITTILDLCFMCWGYQLWKNGYCFRSLFKT